MILKAKLIANYPYPDRIGFLDLVKLIGPLPPKWESKTEKENGFDNHNPDFQVRRNVTCDPVVARFGIFRCPKFPATNKEKERPTDKECSHKPVNDINQVIDIATVLGEIFRNSEPF